MRTGGAGLQVEHFFLEDTGKYPNAPAAINPGRTQGAVLLKIGTNETGY